MTALKPQQFRGKSEYHLSIETQGFPQMEALFSEAGLKARYAEIREKFFPAQVKPKPAHRGPIRRAKVAYVGKEERRDGTGQHWAEKRAAKARQHTMVKKALTQGAENTTP